MICEMEVFEDPFPFIDCGACAVLEKQMARAERAVAKLDAGSGRNG